MSKVLIRSLNNHKCKKKLQREGPIRECDMIKTYI